MLQAAADINNCQLARKHLNFRYFVYEMSGVPLIKVHIL